MKKYFVGFSEIVTHGAVVWAESEVEAKVIGTYYFENGDRDFVFNEQGQGATLESVEQIDEHLDTLLPSFDKDGYCGKDFTQKPRNRE